MDQFFSWVSYILSLWGEGTEGEVKSASCSQLVDRCKGKGRSTSKIRSKMSRFYKLVHDASHQRPGALEPGCSDVSKLYS